ncbi:hypothetical protein HZU83_22255 [Sphaerotilus montanus]|uniref:hypothetical protein n=1 Tax=Sphaerotilus montanus TaxID=522889 RepID=UPI0015D8EC22|nr:hypothetical protein [Sphaerotilus montanus]NZD59399.1 hypothetical protein [Sphaerotilus montanus]
MVVELYSQPHMAFLSSRPVLAWRAFAAAWRWSPGSACQVCATWQRDAVCCDCQRRFRHTRRHRCRCCAAPLASLSEVCGRCVLRPPAFDQTLAALDYAYPWDGLITRFKFGGACELAGPLADLMSDALWTAAEQTGFEPPDVLLPVPLSAARQRARGARGFDPEQAQARAGADRQAVTQRHGVARRQRQRVEARALARGVAVVQMGADAAVRRLHQAALQRQLQTPGIGAAAGIRVDAAAGQRQRRIGLPGRIVQRRQPLPAIGGLGGRSRGDHEGRQQGRQQRDRGACSCDLHGPNLDRLTRREHEIDHVPVLVRPPVQAGPRRTQ